MAISQLQSKLTQSANRKRQLEQDLEHITQEMYRRNKELADTNRTLSLLRTIDSLVLESHDSIKVLSEQIAAAIAKTTEYPLIAIYGASALATDKLEPYGVKLTGIEVESEILLDIKPTTKHQWYKSHDKDRLVSLLHTTPKEIAYYLGCSIPIAEHLKHGPVKSIYLSKLVARQKLVGVMAIGSTGPALDFSASDLNLLQRLGEAIGIALDNKLLFEENQQVLQQLKKANSRLKELDHTKDEFISMASHQLRTPLTTIKGYLSMVLEGDVGPVTKNEKQMIQQAFDSAERMVFLIADLLNVSRLQSGKFVIENKPTDLAKMVEGEVNQLQETAKNHHLTLTYKPPEKLPKLNLDDTKIRQVVMNFLDNAIYYTPAGGSIEAKIELTDDSVSYTVTDTGLGVPTAEQHHLFSKFYRAGNARKMRPDGTGLGLFMAKKVIVAQGGAIIFKSTEGKGSTFGFSFPRKSVEIKA
ncbi:GAF domain-containing sensor histidine kinase [Candidatus Saccharibacteria bacterium]|nr:GAF domain-containing sensor histidine kinase [Candidatus Saccharibacteria bacterium]